MIGGGLDVNRFEDDPGNLLEIYLEIIPNWRQEVNRLIPVLVCALLFV